MTMTWQNYSRFPEPRDEEQADDFEAVELCADEIENAGEGVSDDDFRHACCVALVRDITRNGGEQGQREANLDRMISFIRAEFNRKMAIPRLLAEG